MSQAYDLGLTGKSNPHRAFIGFQLQMALSRDIPATRDLFRSLLAPDTEEVMFRTKKAARSLLLISHDKPRNTELFQRFKNELINRTEYVQPFKSSATYDFGTVSISSVMHDQRRTKSPCLATRYITSPYHISPQLILPQLTSPQLTPPQLTSPQLTSPRLTSPKLTSPQLTLPQLTSLQLTSPHHSSPRHSSAHLTSPHYS